MLFNSYVFIFLFLPIAAAIFFVLGNKGWYRVALGWLVCASLLFYGWWNPYYIILLLASIGVNYLLGLQLNAVMSSSARKILLISGCTFNLGLLGFFKYYDFFIENLNRWSGASVPFLYLALPLAISFFTFQQIAYIVDVYKGKDCEKRLLNYTLFVSFFPQLIAGPIVYHTETLPQFVRPETFRFEPRNLAIGFSIFTIGFAKKVLVADNFALYANPVFAEAAAGTLLSILESWSGAIAYSFQLYFDFSGYSDMAIGLALIFGICLPINFNSPYRATNIIDFWRRWHMTLSRFLRIYLYIPLGGNRRGNTRRFTNVIITMLLGGLWHGAGWTFVLWGGLHSIYILCNHGWHALRSLIGQDLSHSTRIGRIISRVITFVAVTVAWACFRADSTDTALGMIRGMMGFNGFILPSPHFTMLGDLGPWLGNQGVGFADIFLYPGIKGWAVLCLTLLSIWCAPNTQELMANYHQHFKDYKRPWTFPSWVLWRPNVLWALALAVLFSATFLHLANPTEFLYFNF